MKEQEHEQAAADLLRDMVAIAARMRELIVAMPPHDLLGYIYSQRMMGAMVGEDRSGEGKSNDLTAEIQFLLEYVHAVLASDVDPPAQNFDESDYAELFELSRNLKTQATVYAMASTAGKEDGVFGPDTAHIEFRAKSNWVVMRGNRYQVLEGEFYHYVLAPHDDALRNAYGVGAAEIAEGFQSMTDAMRSGHNEAIEEINKQKNAAHAFAASQGKSLEDVMEAWATDNKDSTDSAAQAIDNLMRGGVANVSRHTELPAVLLGDLAYQRGEEVDFFAAGDFSGSPYRTLPARKRPLIQLGSDYYAVDPCFVRDAGYRALLYNLLERQPEYRNDFEARQKSLSEVAYVDILADQLSGAKVFQEVYYKDPTSKQWVENDTLVLIDDVLFLIEAKSGAAATIASPELDFERHAQSVQDLVIKAYEQCLRFFEYLSSADEVPLFKLEGGKYKEVVRVRRSDYRVMFPIGLTVESFAPFSTYCKDLTQIEPLLGKHAFISQSIDDLFVLKRFLSTPGEFAHYMEVRQAVAGIRGAHLFDEFDHLGAYLTKNRVDQDITEYMNMGKADLLVFDGMCEVVNRSFEGEGWESNSFPKQEFPDEVAKLLAALDSTRESGWLSAESHIRDLGEDGRNDLGKTLSSFCQTLNKHPARYFILGGDERPIFVWVQSSAHEVEMSKVAGKASAAALAYDASDAICILASVSAEGVYSCARTLPVVMPTEKTEENTQIYDEAEKMVQSRRVREIGEKKEKARPVKRKKMGRNELCYCGSGKKYKRCHGR